MISYLRLNNFRRHEDTELFLSDAEQVVLIAGPNGAGKSTIVEAILFAFYGEGRNGRGNLDRLVRRGAELEGMEVEVRFDVAGAEYQVRRRRDTKLTSATITCNDAALAEGPVEVTHEVTRILGMDSKAFRLASYAQQRELDGLASLRPAERAREVSRLLRLDVITQAKDAARREARSQQQVIERLPVLADVDALKSTINEVSEEIRSHTDALELAAATVEDFEAHLAATATAEQAYHQAAKALAAAEGALAAATESHTRTTAALSTVTVPDVGPAPEFDVAAINRQVVNLEKSISAAESQVRVHQQIAVAEAEMDKIDSNLQQIIISSESPTSGSLDDANGAVERTSDALDDARVLLESAAQAEAVAAERLRAAQERSQAALDLGDTCDLCGQCVSDEHRVSQAAARTAAVTEAYDTVATARTAASAAFDTVQVATGAYAEAREAFAELRTQIETAQRHSLSRQDLLRRRQIYLDQITNMSADEVDIAALLARRASLEEAAKAAESWERESAVRSVALARSESLMAATATTAAHLEACQQTVESLAIPTDVEAAFTERLDVSSRLADERLIAASLRTDLAVLQERLERLTLDVSAAESEKGRREAQRSTAEATMWAATALGSVESRWVEQLRPTLNGTVSDLLSRLSDGRFDQVTVDADYRISVEDSDGAVRPLSEYSGGEIDLVALAMRLGLAGLVSDRHGGRGLNMLILDECFGSQDPARREAILNAMRGLRTTYGQIFLISHVDGIEDAADTVIDVSWDTAQNISRVS